MFIVTESNVDADFLQWILQGEIHESSVTIRSARGKSSAESLARSLLATRREPVVLALDADSVDSSVTEEQHAYYTYSLHQAGGNTPFHVTLFRPTIEAVVFHDRDLVRSLSKKEVTELDDLEAQFKPKEVLAKLLDVSPSQNPLAAFMKAASSMSSGTLREHPEITSLRDFMHQALTQLELVAE